MSSPQVTSIVPPLGVYRSALSMTLARARSNPSRSIVTEGLELTVIRNSMPCSAAESSNAAMALPTAAARSVRLQSGPLVDLRPCVVEQAADEAVDLPRLLLCLAEPLLGVTDARSNRIEIAA